MISHAWESMAAKAIVVRETTVTKATRRGKRGVVIVKVALVQGTHLFLPLVKAKKSLNCICVLLLRFSLAFKTGVETSYSIVLILDRQNRVCNMAALAVTNLVIAVLVQLATEVIPHGPKVDAI